MKTSKPSNALRLVSWVLVISLAAFCFGLSPAVASAQATQVDIATDATDPSNLNDFEPSLAVNPANPLQIAVVTFSEQWTAGTAPVWRSDDGGRTWRKEFQLPQPSSLCGPGDQKIAFDASGSLYVAELGGDCMTGAPQDFIYRQTGAENDPLTIGASYGDDQPHIDVDKASGTGCPSRLYSPWLNFNVSNERSTVSDSTTGGAAMTDVAAGNNSFPDRTTRIALSSDGKAYIIYKSREGTVAGGFENVHFYVRRSDDCGGTWTANGGTSGVSVHGSGTVQTWFTTTWGNPSKGPTAKARSSDAWIAVDPTSGDVYAAYVSKDSSTFGQIYVARSTTQGTSWMTPVRVTDGTHHSAYPEIAVTANGTVGVLYIDYDDSGTDILYRHHFARSFDQGGHWSHETLQSMDPNSFAIPATNPPLWGDYEGLTAVGKIFYGIYTGQSTGRSTTQLDPIFFSESGVPASSDFYVRDWTTNASTHDNGEEPSTNSDWWDTGDVWNRLTNTPGTFDPTTDRPDHHNALIGTNFAFARISRKAAAAMGSPDIAVTPTFLYADYGNGVNYVNLGSAPAVTFHATDTTPVVTSGLSWTLPATHSTHVCMAVEISSPGDPFSPDLTNRAPGVSDPLIPTDNNKAQKNMDLVLGEQGGDFSFYAVIHNPDLFVHDVTMQYDASPGVVERMGGALVEAVGGESQPFRRGGTINFAKMQPGENRWIGLSFALHGQGGGPMPVAFSEINGKAVVNGFTIVMHPSSSSEVIRQNLQSHRDVFLRLSRAFHIPQGETESKAAAGLLEQRQITAQEYVGFLQQHAHPVSLAVSQLLAMEKMPDQFGIQQSIEKLDAALGAGQTGAVESAHATLLNKLDGFQTMLQKAQGDPADILQMVRWQVLLYSTLPELKQLPATRFVVKESREFIQDFGKRKRGADHYPELMRELLKSFRSTEEVLEKHGLNLEPEIEQIEARLHSERGLEKAHRDYLLKLQSILR
ncbi:MAG TPA: sialidase family protein [Candidatus Bathyarchaeia archaeon]|jgi:hypothetical protein|nr:sialidase family protein [Candidatus Bathyarchaeia archaeon]